MPIAFMIAIETTTVERCAMVNHICVCMPIGTIGNAYSDVC